MIALAAMLGGGSACAAAAGPRAAAAGGQRNVSVKVVHHSAHHRLTVAVVVRTERYTACSGRITHGHDALRLRTLRTSPHDGAGRWQWDVARGVRAGVWAARIACQTRSGIARGTERARTGAGPPGHHVPGQLAAPGTMHVDDHGTGSGGGDNPYPQGQCTWWAWGKRTDLPFFPDLAGDALNWADSARRAGWPIGTTPVAGAIAVFRPHLDGAGYLGHVAYVEAVHDDMITISEADFAGFPPGHERTIPARGLVFIYGGPAGDGHGHVTRKPLPTVTPAPGLFVHHVYHTCANGACGLQKRTGPDYTHYHTLAVLLDGAEVGISCQTRGESVRGIDGSASDVWDQLSDGSYVADYYVDTPGTLGHFSPPIPTCVGPNPQPDLEPPPGSTYQVTGTCADNACALNERSGPGYTAFPIVGTLAEGASVTIVCQTSGESVGTSQTYFTVVWDKLTDGRFVSDYYVDTPGSATGFTDSIPRC